MDLTKIRTRILPNLRYVPRSQVRTCRACGHLTIFVSLGNCDEHRLCIRCRANLRYELLAQCIKGLGLPAMDVLELDYKSPLRGLLLQARTYTRSFYRDGLTPGDAGHDGAVCQDITRLTFPDNSLDLIISSDVLEHVPDARAAFRETARVLKPGGVHLFTVPPRAHTRLRSGLMPEYHYDPLNPQGILVYWDYGPDLPQVMATPGLHFEIAAGPEGDEGRTVWAAHG